MTFTLKEKYCNKIYCKNWTIVKSGFATFMESFAYIAIRKREIEKIKEYHSRTREYNITIEFGIFDDQGNLMGKYQ